MKSNTFQFKITTNSKQPKQELKKPFAKIVQEKFYEKKIQFLFDHCQTVEEVIHKINHDENFVI